MIVCGGSLAFVDSGLLKKQGRGGAYQPGGQGLTAQPYVIPGYAFYVKVFVAMTTAGSR